MLILTRRVGETLMIGGDQITVTMLGVKGQQVRIGIKAPTSCSVDREEIFRRKQIEAGRAGGAETVKDSGHLAAKPREQS